MKTLKLIITRNHEDREVEIPLDQKVIVYEPLKRRFATIQAKDLRFDDELVINDVSYQISKSDVLQNN